MTIDWESTLEDYLEGRVPREQIDDLLMRLDLEPAAREEIAEMLSVSKTLDQTMKFGRTATDDASAIDAILGALRKMPTPQAPVSWANPAPVDASDPEELYMRFVEGRATQAQMRQLLARPDLDADLREDIRDSLGLGDRLDAALAVDESAIDAGMNNLLQKLNNPLPVDLDDSDSTDTAGPINPVIGTLYAERDVLAASTDADQAGGKKDDDEKSPLPEEDRDPPKGD